MRHTRGTGRVRARHSKPALAWIIGIHNFKNKDWYVFVYTATEFAGELIDSPEGKLEWIPDEKPSSLDLWESDHIFFLWIDAVKLFSAKFEYDEYTMRAYNVVFHS